MVLVAAYETVDVRISGISSSYPPVISAIRKIAVRGACMTPDMSPAIPTRTKFCSGTTAPPPIRFIVLDTKNPAMAPMNRVGPNVPPTPPPALVNDMEKTFRIRIRRKNIGMDHSLCMKNASMVSPSRSIMPPFRRV